MPPASHLLYMSQKDGGGSNPYSDKSPFVRLLETRGRVRILDAFLNKYQTEMSAKDLNELTGVSESTFSRNKDVLLELDILEKSKNENGKQYYQLNLDSSLVQLLGEFHTRLLEHSDYVSSNTIISEEDYIGKIISTESSTDIEQADDTEESVMTKFETNG